MPPSGRRAERTSSTRWVEKSLQAGRLLVIEQGGHALGDEIVGIAPGRRRRARR